MRKDLNYISKNESYGLLNQKYHYYKCHNLTKAPEPYAIYDYAKGAVGYKNKLNKEVQQSLGFIYLGRLTDKELNKPVQPTKPAKLNRRYAK